MTLHGKIIAAFFAVLSAAALAAQTSSPAKIDEGRSAQALDALRERISINEDWRFQKEEPGVNSASLPYDVRPVVKDSKDDKAADSQPQAVEKNTAPVQAVLKPWILPTGNRFIKDPARRFVRPDGNPGGDVPYVQSHFDDVAWRLVNLPHDWAIEGPFYTGGEGVGGGMGRLPSPGVAWYRKKLKLPTTDAGKSIFLDVDGAMSYATVWLNGKLVGGWPYGYTSWRVDLTPYVVFGAENQLAIRLDNPSDSSRWYPGGGIYRNVWLTKTQPVHVAQWGTRVTTPLVSASSATINLDVTIDNDSKTDATVGVSTRIYALDADDKKTGDSVAILETMEMHIAAGQSSTVKGSTSLANPRLWGAAAATEAQPLRGGNHRSVTGQADRSL